MDSARPCVPPCYSTLSSLAISPDNKRGLTTTTSDEQEGSISIFRFEDEQAHAHTPHVTLALSLVASSPLFSSSAKSATKMMGKKACSRYNMRLNCRFLLPSARRARYSPFLAFRRKKKTKSLSSHSSQNSFVLKSCSFCPIAACSIA